MLEPCFSVNSVIAQSANIAIRKVLAVKKGEHVLIITNPIQDVFRISQALYTSCHETGAASTLMVQPTKTTFDYAEPSVINAIKSEPEVIISISAERLGKDKEALANPYIGLNKKCYTHIFDQLLYGLEKTRAFWSPTITVDMFTRTIPINYATLGQVSATIQAYLNRASFVRVQTALGTDITVSVGGRKAMSDDGNFRTLGKGGNLPCGEVFISPVLGQSSGVIVFDGSITLDKTTVIKTPIQLTVERGFVMNIEGGEEAKQLDNYLKKATALPFALAKKGEITFEKAKEYSKNATNLGEFGIGLNPKATIIGNVLEDEKVLGTVHFAIGSNYDQDALALIHSDGVVKNPTIEIDEKIIMADGNLLI